MKNSLFPLLFALLAASSPGSAQTPASAPSPKTDAAPATAQTIIPPLDQVTDSAVWRVHNRAAKFMDVAGKKAAYLDARTDAGFVWLVGSDFSEGTIELDLRGRDVDQKSFVGLAFRGVDDTTYDAVYFRPFNFKSADIPRRARAVQYISAPNFDWPKLRADFPGKYEATVSPVPDPNGWFHARIVVAERKVSVFVNDATAPSLVITELTARRGGPIGLWVGNGSDGAFANLKITPKKQ